MKDLDIVKKLQNKKDSFQYTVTSEKTSVTMTIKSSDPAAVETLHTYLKYLEERWKF